MKKYLIPENGKYFKANLHCHSTISDGRFTPEELKALYKDKGYSVIAYTDHRRMRDHSNLNDDSFLALTGYEMDFNPKDSRGYKFIKTCHINLISPKADDELDDFDKLSYNPETINAYVRKYRDKGFVVNYNHPEWSLEDQNEYGAYEGFSGMEIYNHGCYVEGYHEENAIIYENMLKRNGKLFCVATDDNHIIEHCFGGYVMIKADSLDYDTIFAALENGDFYASYGANIEELYIEDGVMHVTSRGASEIAFTTAIRTSARAIAKEGELLTHAQYEIDPDDIFVKVEVIAPNGKRAYTNAYFI